MLVGEDSSVGILPVGAAATIATWGLYWDVRDWRTEFGGNVSTSNRTTGQTFEVQTDRPVLVSVEIRKDLRG
jgi:thiamine pyrophosphokinase